MRGCLEFQPIEGIDIAEVPDKRVQLALEGQNLRIVQVQASKPCDMANLVEGNGHGHDSVAQP